MGQLLWITEEQIVIGVPSANIMDSLDLHPPAVSPAKLSSIGILSTQKPAKDGANHEVNSPASKRFQPEHIYDQLIPNGHCKHGKEGDDEEEEKEEKEPHKKVLPHKPKTVPDKTLLPDHLPPPPPPPPLRPLSPWSSAPDVRKSENLNFNPKGPTFASLSTSKKKPSLPLKGPPFADEDPSVFSISGRRVVVANGFKGGSDKKGDHSLPQRASSPERKITNGTCNQRSSEDLNLIDMKRRRLQRFTDCFSLCLFVPSTILCVLSPWLLIPIYVIPNFMANYFQTLLWVCCIASTMLVFVGCLVGNMVWYKRSGRWRCLLHCGKGPRGHYWGNTIPSRNDLHTV